MDCLTCGSCTLSRREVIVCLSAWICAQSAFRRVFCSGVRFFSFSAMSGKALCDKHDADEAQGLDLAAFTKVLIARLS